MKRVLIIDGHPDARADRYLHALAKAYWDGAHQAGHELASIIVSELEFPLLRTAEDFQSAQPYGDLSECQDQIRWADHLVILYPLWLGSMPAILKGFLEQVLRPGFAFAQLRDRGHAQKLLAGKSARVIVTMGMPALFYKWYYRAHSLKSLERNILAFCGVAPVRATMVGDIEGMTSAQRGAWLARIEALGRSAR